MLSDDECLRGSGVGDFEVLPLLFVSVRIHVVSRFNLTGTSDGA